MFKKVFKPEGFQGLSLEEYSKYTKYTPERVESIEDIANFGKFTRKRLTKLLDGKDFHIHPFANGAEEKIVKPGDWGYYINKFNFRDEFNLETKKPKIGFFGCSFTFGEGIESKDTFAQLSAEELNFSAFNFGIGGSSIHKIARTFSAVTKFIDLDYAVVTLPHWHRQLYLNEDGEMINLIPGYPHNGYEKVTRQITELDDTYLMLLATTMISWINDVAEKNSVKVLFGSWDHALCDICRTMLPEQTLKPFPNIDNATARDKMHPGILSHEAYTKMIVEAVNGY